MINPVHIRVIAKNVVMENLRNKVFLFLVLGGLFFLMFSFLLANMAVGDPLRVIQDYGFWVMGIWGLITASFFGVNIIKHELMNKTIYLLMSRPVAKAEFIFGKFFGIVSLNLLVFSVLGSGFLSILIIAGLNLSPAHAVALVCIFCEWVLLSVFSLLFAVLTSPVLHIFFITGVYLMGHWSKYLYIYSKNMASDFISPLLVALYRVVPNLELLNFREAAIYGDAVGTVVVLKSFLVWSLWSLTGLVLTTVIFNRRRVL